MNIKTVSPINLTEQFIQANLEDEKQITSKLAIVIHGNGSGSRSCVTRHTIKNGKMALGEVISVEELSQTLIDLQTKNTSIKSTIAPSEFIESNIIASSSKMLAWHTPRKEQTLFLSKSSVKVTLPPLLYVYRPAMGHGNASLAIFALAANKRPTAETKLYHAPLMNIYGDGKLCLGSMIIPQKITDTTTKTVENEFFGSKFTHPNTQKITRKPVNIEVFYHQKEKSGKPIMTSELMPMNTTVGQVLGRN
jgi:PRTRC genetic system protein B